MLSMARAKVKSASQLLPVTLPMRARSLLPHKRLQLLGLEVAPSPTQPAAMGFPKEGDPSLQELCHLRGRPPPRSSPQPARRRAAGRRCCSKSLGKARHGSRGRNFQLVLCSLHPSQGTHLATARSSPPLHDVIGPGSQSPDTSPITVLPSVPRTRSKNHLTSLFGVLSELSKPELAETRFINLLMRLPA